MTIQLQCVCGKSLTYPDSYEGKKIPCRYCRASVIVAGEKVQPPTKANKIRLWLGVLLLVIPAIVATIFIRSRAPRFTSAAEEYKDGSKAAVDPKADGPRLEQLFASLAAASKEGNEEAFAHCFHERRMLAEIELRGNVRGVGRKRDETGLEGELRSICRNWCDQLKNSFSAWQSVQRCTFRFIDGRGEAEASVSFRTADHLSRFRCWLIKENDAWTIFDFESLEEGYRMSLTPRVVSPNLDKARNLIARENSDQALGILESMDDRSPAVALLHAEALFRLKRLDEAIALLEGMKGIPRAAQLRGIILHHLSRYEDGIRCQEEFMKTVGEDPVAWNWIGKGYEAMGKTDKAIDAYRKGAASDELETANRLKLKQLEGSGK